jgi:hypothetical protein
MTNIILYIQYSLANNNGIFSFPENLHPYIKIALRRNISLPFLFKYLYYVTLLSCFFEIVKGQVCHATLRIGRVSGKKREQIIFYHFNMALNTVVGYESYSAAFPIKEKKSGLLYAKHQTDA